MADGHTPISPFYAQAAQIVADQQKARDRWIPTGVSWSGITSNPCPVVETIDAVVARLEQQAAARDEFLATPRGRFITAIVALGEDDHDAFLKLRGEFDRSITTLNGPTLQSYGLASVGRCIRLLAAMESVHAQAAEEALADLLIADAQLREAA